MRQPERSLSSFCSFLGACGSGTSGGDAGGKDGNGNFTLNLTDAPIDQDDDLQFAGTRNVSVVEGLVVVADLES